MKSHFFSQYKIALKANSSTDLLRAMLFLWQKSERVTCISMGEFGLPSRVLGPILGSLISYTSLEMEEEPIYRYDIETLIEKFNFRKLKKTTKIFALLGNPVKQSIGDTFHNRIFDQNQVDAVYVKILVKETELAELFPLIQKLPFSGLSVTMPFKQTILPLLDHIEEKAREASAVNTVVFKEGLSFGSNTDGLGAIFAILRHMEIEGKKIAILGAGGSARAIAQEAIGRGGEVTLFNRTLSKASIGNCRALPLEKLSFQFFDLLINTLPISIPVQPLEKGTYVMDIVYGKRSSLIDMALKNGCKVIYGEEMFLSQAKLQQIAFTEALYR